MRIGLIIMAGLLASPCMADDVRQCEEHSLKVGQLLSWQTSGEDDTHIIDTSSLHLLAKEPINKLIVCEANYFIKRELSPIVSSLKKYKQKQNTELVNWIYSTLKRKVIFSIQPYDSNAPIITIINDD